MRGYLALWLLLGLAACGDSPGKAPKASEQAAIERSVADVAAAASAASAPLPPPIEADAEKSTAKAAEEKARR